MLYKFLGVPHVDPRQHFTIDCDLLTEINKASILRFFVLRKGRQMMTSLDTCQACSPSKKLQSSQGRCHLAYRVRKREH